MTVKRTDVDNIPTIRSSSTCKRSERLKLKIVDFDAEIIRINSEALDCTRRMVTELDKINEEGMVALASLENQDEQLDKMEDNLYKINDDISAVRKDMGKIQRCCCFAFLCFPFKCFRTSKNEHIQEQTAQSSIIVKHNSIRHQGPFIKRLTNDVVEEEIEGNLKQVDDTLNSIKHLAIDINVQLSIQEPKLDRIHQLVENSDIAMDGANERVKKLLGE